MNAPWVKWLGAVLGLLVAAGALGITMPWKAQSAAEARREFQNKEEAQRVHDELRRDIRDNLKLILDEIRRAHGD
jgi:hypothetical protein